MSLHFLLYLFLNFINSIPNKEFMMSPREMKKNVVSALIMNVIILQKSVLIMRLTVWKQKLMVKIVLNLARVYLIIVYCVVGLEKNVWNVQIMRPGEFIVINLVKDVQEENALLMMVNVRKMLHIVMIQHIMMNIAIHHAI